MKLIKTNDPDRWQTNDLNILQEACNNTDHISFTFPLEEDCICCLLYENDRLLSALIAFFTDPDTMECYGLTLPGERQKGYFTMLLDELTNDYPDSDLIFPVYENWQDGIKTLQTMEASFCYREYFMECFVPRPDKSVLAGLTISYQTCKNQINFEFCKDQKAVGKCYLHIQGKKAYFYGFEISEPLRGQGLGTACMQLFFKTYCSLPADLRKDTIYLQVSGDNLPAVALYKKAGFQITDSLSYYLY